MRWTAENNEKLLRAIFEVCNVRPTAADKEKIAQIMGDDCTAKAITHRISHLRGDDRKAKSPGPKTPQASAKRAAPGMGSQTGPPITPIDSDSDIGEAITPRAIKKMKKDESKDDKKVIKAEDIGSDLDFA